MQFENEKILLRNMKLSDIEDIIYWNTEACEWMQWDAPWERENNDVDWDAYRIKKAAEIQERKEDDALVCRFEVCIKNDEKTHIGAVSCYFIDEEYRIVDHSDRIAIGMDIYETTYRRNGYGSSAYRLYMEYLKTKGYTDIYTQTWSGNLPLIAMAKRLGFEECNRYVGLRQVRGKTYDGLTFVKHLK